MASNPAWRHPLEDWRSAIDGWVARAQGENLLAVDIFYDFARVAGDQDLARALRGHAMAAAAGGTALVRNMAQALEDVTAPLGLFGGIRTVQGRVDLKLHGLFPLVAGARALALKLGSAETSTAARLSAAAEAGSINTADLEGLLEAQALFMDLILKQQILDMKAGGAPGTKIEVAGLSPGRKRLLKLCLKRAADMAVTARAALSRE